MKRTFFGAIAALSLSGCQALPVAENKPAQPAAAAGRSARSALAGQFAGKWIGVEGTEGNLRIVLRQEAGATWVGEAMFTYEGTEIPGRVKTVEADGTKLRMVFDWEIQGTAGQSTLNENRCNFYIGKTPTDWKTVFTEGTSIPASSQTARWSSTISSPRIVRLVVKFSSGVGKADGWIRRYINGALEFEKLNWQFDTTARPTKYGLFFIQVDYSPNTGDTGPFKATDWVKFRPLSVVVR